MAYKDILAAHNERLDALTEWTGEEAKAVMRSILDKSATELKSSATSLTGYALARFVDLTVVDLSAATSIAIAAFHRDSKLDTLIIRTNTVCTLAGIDAFVMTPIALGKGYIYVPRSLVDAYKAATNWSTYAARFRAIEDYPDVCGGKNMVDYSYMISNLNTRLSDIVDEANRLPDCITTLLDGSITVLRDAEITSIGENALYGRKSLIVVDLPSVTSIGNASFCECDSLPKVSIPSVTNIGRLAFGQCYALTTVGFPLLTSISDSTFYFCTSLTTADFPLVTSINDAAFQNTQQLETLILRSETVATLAATSAFTNSAIANNSTKGYIYVPRSLVDTYKAATNWSTYANKFRALEDYTVDGTIYGELR